MTRDELDRYGWRGWICHRCGEWGRGDMPQEHPLRCLARFGRAVDALGFWLIRTGRRFTDWARRTGT